ncbi:DUF7344 domain-containing protein [Natronococcus jeotgali]|uniref:DUF7344 domain-containing protein n=1 Tax=Natronococcus jeotgali DSM 18795 TaxID=1227498 RepID=L9X8H1_9EURY|nr:hypothetical protein [Natronococcus jeotgali]ELY56938.1 hypothetical protein C492_14035 [Natronococcus jeotgali DSM 18795]
MGTQRRSYAAVRIDDLYEGLSVERRRHALSCLRDHDLPIALADLADEVAVRERGTRLPAVPAEETNRIYLSLYHAHVPKLVDVGLVTYHQDRDLVGAAPSVDLEEVLEGRLER